MSKKIKIVVIAGLAILGSVCFSVSKVNYGSSMVLLLENAEALADGEGDLQAGIWTYLGDNAFGDKLYKFTCHSSGTSYAKCGDEKTEKATK